MKLLSEKFVQNSIIEHLFRKGWGRNLRSKGLDDHGVDIKVTNNRYSRCWLIECKGDASESAMYPRSHRQVCFWLALGQIITRMKTDGKPGYKYRYKFGVGFPEWFRDLVVKHLPYDVAQKLNLYVFLVAADGSVDSLDWNKLKAAQFPH